MNNNPYPKKYARLGVFYLEEAVLDALLETKDECIGAAEISKRAGVYRPTHDKATFNESITNGILSKLENEGRIEKCLQPNNRGGWKITDKELSERQ